MNNSRMEKGRNRNLRISIVRSNCPGSRRDISMKTINDLLGLDILISCFVYCDYSASHTNQTSGNITGGKDGCSAW